MDRSYHRRVRTPPLLLCRAGDGDPSRDGDGEPTRRRCLPFFGVVVPVTVLLFVGVAATTAAAAAAAAAPPVALLGAPANTWQSRANTIPPTTQPLATS